MQYAWINNGSFLPKQILTTLLVLTCACEKQDVVPDNKPRIVEMEVVGIDKESVFIDQEKNVITIELPEGMNDPQLYTKIKLTHGAELVPRTYGTRIDLTSGLPEDKFFMTTQKDAGIKADTVKYELQFIQKESLKIELEDESSANPYQIAHGELFRLEVGNFLDGSFGEIHLEHQLDPNVPKIVINGYEFNFRDNPGGGILNGRLELEIPIASHVVPGPYSVSFHKKNGRSATASKPLVLTKGPIRLSWSGYVPQRSIKGAPVKITGYNLYESNNLSVALIDKDGKKYQTKITKYDPFGLSLTFDPGQNIKPGYYTLQIFSNGKLCTYFDGTSVFQNYRFAVTKTAQQPFIMTFERSNDTNQEYADVSSYKDKPLIFQSGAGGGQIYWGFANHKTSMLWFDVELESTTQPGYLKRKDVWIRDWSTYSEGVELKLGDLFYPDYPSGKYRLRVVVTNPETHEEYKSEPFERVVEIR